MATATATRYDVVPLSKHIGAEVRGLDLSGPIDRDAIAFINKVWLDHQVLVLRDQKLTQEDQLRITSYFGEIGHLHRPAKFFPPGFSKILPDIMMISNIRENGEPIGALPDGEMMFHHDMIHTDIPHKGTMLYSVEIPSRGGDTLFSSGYAAYETLDQAIRKRLEGRMAKHHYNYGSTIKGDGKGVEAFGEAVHPVFRTHDDTKRKAVYVNRLMTVGVVDMPQDESDELLGAVYDHMEKPEFVYAHEWRVGDILLWDNRCSAHARTDFPGTERRLMLRTTLKGSAKPV